MAGDARDRPRRRSRETVEAEGSFERWHGRGALGYLVLDAVVRTQLADPPERTRIVVCEQTFPTGMLGDWVRRLAEGGLVAVLTATSPPRLGPPGGPKLAGTNPLAIGIPSSDGEPVVVDVSMGAVTWGDVIAGLASEEELVPFGGEQWHKALALARRAAALRRRTAARVRLRRGARSSRGRSPIRCRRCGRRAGFRLPGDS